MSTTRATRVALWVVALGLLVACGKAPSQESEGHDSSGPPDLSSGGEGSCEVVVTDGAAIPDALEIGAGLDLVDATDIAGAEDGAATLDGTAMPELVEASEPHDAAAEASLDGGNVCAPSCEGKDCGLDGCGGVCGTCLLNQTCDDGLCTDSPPPSVPIGEACFPTETCAEPIPDPQSGALVDNPEWPSCLSDMCGEGLCFDFACSHHCVFSKDTVDNATGEPGHDNIADEDDPLDDCGDTVDGPFGTEYKCIKLYSPSLGSGNYCMPGTTFAHCDTSVDCPVGESCRWLLLDGFSEKRCMAAPKDGKSVGARCTFSPWVGPVESCTSTLCLDGMVCADVCVSDADCVVTPGACQGGMCQTTAEPTPCTTDAECSPMRCIETEDSFAFAWGAAGDATFCLPSPCSTSADCHDDEFSCVLSTGTGGADFVQVDGQEVRVQRCLPIPEGAVAMGAPCTEGMYSASPCAEGLCRAGVCSGLCETDDDCPSTMRCVEVEEHSWWGDGPPGMSPWTTTHKECRWVGQEPSMTCVDEGSCGEGASCVPFALAIDEGVQVETLCVLHEPLATIDQGDPCGPELGQSCATSLCLDGRWLPKGDGFCTSICSSHAACVPPSSEVDDAPHGVAVCESVVWRFEDIAWGDEVWLPVCVPSGYGGSLADCSDGFACSVEGEVCIPHAMGRGCGASCTVEYLCQAPLPDEVPGTLASLGEPCNYNSATPQCQGGVCIQGAGGEGYCTRLCTGDQACEGSAVPMACSPHDPMRCPGGDGQCSYPVCKKQLSCLPCDVDDDCATGYVCVNVGGVYLSAEYRCAPDCWSDTDCIGTDGGSVCAVTVDAYGDPQGSACVPTCW